MRIFDFNNICMYVEIILTLDLRYFGGYFVIKKKSNLGTEVNVI